MPNTQNYNFKKDAPTDFYSVDTVNQNLDAIDTAIKSVEDKAGVTQFNGRKGKVIPEVGDYQDFYLGKAATAEDSKKLNGKPSTDYALASQLLSTQTQLLQAQSDITNLTQQLNNKAGEPTWIYNQSAFHVWHAQLYKTANLVVFNGFINTLQEIPHTTLVGNLPTDFRPRGSRILFSLSEHNSSVKGITLEVTQNGEIRTTDLPIAPGTRYFNACWIS